MASTLATWNERTEPPRSTSDMTGTTGRGLRWSWSGHRQGTPRQARQPRRRRPAGTWRPELRRGRPTTGVVTTDLVAVAPLAGVALGPATMTRPGEAFSDPPTAGRNPRPRSDRASGRLYQKLHGSGDAWSGSSHRCSQRAVRASRRPAQAFRVARHAAPHPNRRSRPESLSVLGARRPWTRPWWTCHWSRRW
jgi:hypothetical protein